MSIKSYESLSMLEISRIISSNRKDGICSLKEPDDTIDFYIDFLEKINPYDWGNDEYLMDLIDNVFTRKKLRNE